MLSALLTVFPVFAMVAAGFAYRKTGVLSKAASVQLNRFVVYFACPVLFLNVMIKATWADSNILKFIFVFCLGCGIVFFVVLALQVLAKRDLSVAGIESLSASYPNTVYLGFPLYVILFGDEFLPALALVSAISSALLFATSISLVEVARETGGGALKILSKVSVSVFSNPFVTAPLVGGLIGAAGVELPRPVESFLELGGAAASPCALFALGAFLAEDDSYAETEDRRTAVLIVVSKLIVHPVITAILAFLVFGLPAELAFGATLLAALPTGAGPFMLAQLYGLEVSVTSRAILRTTLIAILSLSALLHWGQATNL